MCGGGADEKLETLSLVGPFLNRNSLFNTSQRHAVQSSTALRKISLASTAVGCVSLS